MVTDEHVAALRAMLANDFDEHERLVAELDRTDGWGEGYPLLIGAAFFEAVDRRFGKGHTRADIVRFVTAARERFDQDGETVDPRIAELVVQSALDPDSVADQLDGLDGGMMVHIQGVLLVQLVTVDEQLVGERLDEFMADARSLADLFVPE